MKLRHVLVIGAVALAFAGCNEKAEESKAAAPAEVAAPKKDCSECDTHKAQAAAQAVVPAAVPAAAQAAPEMTDAQAMEAAAKKVAASSGTYTVEELFAKKAELNAKVVTVKGEVVKVSNGIMGRSWIHIQDGTGAEGTNDIIFTSKVQTANVGDKVVATGTVATDKDFGYGYFYAVIVEDSAFVMQ